MEQAEEAPDEDEVEGDDVLRVDEMQLLETHKNLYWSRLIAVDRYEPPQQLLRDDSVYRWPLGPDVVAECSAVAELPMCGADQWAPLFEPHDFGEAHGPLLIENYQLPEEDLRTWAE